jgi:hypothetical protein
MFQPIFHPISIPISLPISIPILSLHSIQLFPIFNTSFSMPSKISTGLDESNLLLPAQTEPNKLFCALLNSADFRDGLVRVSYRDYVNAINRCSWWLEEKLGKGDGLSLKTIGYFGPPDIRQTIVALAVSKINHKVKKDTATTITSLWLKYSVDFVVISTKLPRGNTQITSHV